MSKIEGIRKRPKTGGRKAGVPNKVTGAAKDAIAMVFEGMGGADAMLKWADANDDNRKIFYSTIYPKLIPVQLSGEGGGPLMIVTGVPRAND
jgi:hypothetical protein